MSWLKKLACHWRRSALTCSRAEEVIALAHQKSLIPWALSLLNNHMKKLAINLGKSLFWAILCLSLNGCFIRPYKFDLYQGNVITADKVAQIAPGMSQEQVRYVLGTPVLNDVFHTQRWDYIYLEKPGFGKEQRRHLAIYFNDGRVDRISEDPLLDVA